VEQAPAAPKKKRSRWYDGLLVLIELAAVFGLVLIGWQLFTQTRTLGRKPPMPRRCSMSSGALASRRFSRRPA
jgi:hypothetical protein